MDEAKSYLGLGSIRIQLENENGYTDEMCCNGSDDNLVLEPWSEGARKQPRTDGLWLCKQQVLQS